MALVVECVRAGPMWPRDAGTTGRFSADVPLARPCLACSTPTTFGPRCPLCESARQSVRNATRPHYRGDYATRARALRDQASADPSTRCRRCGGLARADDPWQAGHVIDGDPSSPLAPEHASCNAAAGGRTKGGGGQISAAGGA